MSDARSVDARADPRCAGPGAGRPGGAARLSAGGRHRRRPALVELFLERVAEYRATVRRVRPAELEATLAAVCRERGTRTLVAAPGVSWTVDGVDRLAPDGLDARALDAVDGVLTGCALAVAATGTIVLDSSPACGPRVLTLVPDHHLCVVRADQVVPSVPDAVAALEPAARERAARSRSSRGRRPRRTSS